MRHEVSATIRDAPERVWAWWTDYGPVGHEETVRHGIGTSRRRVVSKEGDVVVLRESFLGATLLEHRIELHPARRAFRETSRRFDAWWSFEPAPEGTLVRRDIEIRARFAPLGLARWAARRDLEYHAREYERGQRP